MLQNFTDGVFYMGYALQFRELVHEIGLHYYAVRFPAIAPDALAVWLFGPFGFVVWRYALAGLCCASLFFLFSKRYGDLAGLLAATAWASNPFAVRFLQTAYPDVSGASFLCIGLCLALLPAPRLRQCALAGALLAASAWSHLHAAVALAFCLPLLLAARAGDGWKKGILAAAAGLGGAAALSGAGAAWYFWNYGLWDLTAPTREILKLIASGAVEKPVLAWGQILRENLFWFVPLPLLAAALSLRSPGRFVWCAWFACAGYTVFLTIDDLVKQNYSLSLFYYFSFAVPAVALAVAFLAAEASRQLPPEKSFAYFLACLLFPVVLVGKWDASLAGWMLVSAGACAIPGMILLMRHLRAVCAGLLIVAASVLVAASPAGRIALGNYWKPDDWPILDMAVQLRDILAGSRRRGDVVRFWYADGGGDLRMLQSFFLHEFTKWKTADGGPLAFPDDARITPEFVRQSGVRLLVVLGEDEAGVREAVRNLEARGVKPGSAQTIELGRPGGERLWCAVLTFPETPSREVAALEPEWNKHKKAKWGETKNGKLLVTRSFKGAKDAWAELPELREGDSVEVELRVLRGRVALDLAPGRDEESAAFPRFVTASPSRWKVVLHPADPAKDRVLRIKNMAPEGTPSTVEILGVRLRHEEL